MWDKFMEEWQRVKLLANLERQINAADLTDEEFILLFSDLAEERELSVIKKKDECKVKKKVFKN